MNAFPLIFARARAPEQLSRIRDSFSTNIPTEATITETSPKPVRLKRPGTSLKRTMNDTKDQSELTATAHSPGTTIADLLGTHTHQHMPRIVNFTSKVPCVRGKAIKPKSRLHTSSRVATASPTAILNLETEPTLMLSPGTTSHQRLNVLRAKSAEHREIHRNSKDNHQWDVSVTDLEPYHSPEDLYPITGYEGLTEHSTTSIILGAAQLPTRLTAPSYFESVFGEPVKGTEKHKALIVFLESSLGVTFEWASLIRIAQHPDTQEISLVATGSKAPISRCCKATVVFSCSKTQGGKVLCTASYCPTRTVCNFHIPIDVKDRLWNETVDKAPVMSSWELSAHVRKGSYKVVSLRKEMTKRGKSSSEGYNSLQRRCLFTNERLKHVSPAPSNIMATIHLPICLQTNPIRMPNKGAGSPLRTVLNRSSSRHNTVQQEETPAKLMAQLTCLMQV